MKPVNPNQRAALRLGRHFPKPAAGAMAAAALLAVGCQGTIEDPGTDAGGRGGAAAPNMGGGSGAAGPVGPVGSSTGAGAGAAGASPGATGAAAGVGGTSTIGDPATMTSNPTLAQVAAQYFPGLALGPARKRLFRLTRVQLDNTTKSLLPQQFAATALATLPSDPLQTNYEYADNLGFNAANFTPFTNWVSDIAAKVKVAPSSVIDCAASGNSDACLRSQAKKFVGAAFRGTLSDAELDRYAQFFSDSVKSVGIAAATADLVDVTLTSPHYVFRDEVSTDSSAALLPAQRLQHITYTLADAPPEALGLSSATAAAQVATAELTQKTIDTVLASAEARNKLLRFFLAWLEVKEPEAFTIATSVFPEFTPEVASSIVNETRAFLEARLASAAPKMKDLTESTEGFVSNATAFIYGTGTHGGVSPVSLDPTQRLGIFTTPAVIASHSGPTTTRLVKRGVFFVRKIMCMPLGTPPAGIDLTVPANAGKTERERVETVTAQTQCAGCHSVINPFGFMLENYDAIGRWRTQDEGNPIDANITVSFLDEGALSTQSPVEALRAFTRSYRFQQCFARQLFRFYTGRDETAADDPVLRQMFFDFANGEAQDIVQLLRTMAGGPTFSQRSEAP